MEGVLSSSLNYRADSREQGQRPAQVVDVSDIQFQFGWISGSQVREIRAAIGKTQADFWKEVGVTQGGGSRYEEGRRIPSPVRALLHLKYPRLGKAGMHS